MIESKEGFLTFTTHDREHERHCTRGAVACAINGHRDIVQYGWGGLWSDPDFVEVDRALHRAALKLYGDEIPQSYQKVTGAHIFVNNLMGHRAALAVFDEAIRLASPN
jgi:hypothetical protein